MLSFHTKNISPLNSLQLCVRGLEQNVFVEISGCLYFFISCMRFIFTQLVFCILILVQHFCEIIMFSVSSKKEGMAKEEMWQYPMAMVVHFFFFPKHIKFHWTWVE